MVNFKSNIKLENPDLLVKFDITTTRSIPFFNSKLRFLDRSHNYYVHPYKIGTQPVHIGKVSYSNLTINFKCAEENCELCEKDYLIQKRYCYPVLNRSNIELEVLDLNKSDYTLFENYCAYNKVSKLHEDDFFVIANMFSGNVTFSLTSADELLEDEVQKILGLSSVWLEEYLEKSPSFKEAKASVKAQKIVLPDGSWALRCCQCNFESQWAEPNQSDGSFRCGRCRMLSP